MQIRPLNQKVTVSIVFVLGMFMSIMDTTIVNVALPSIGAQFHVSSVAVDAVVVAYLVTLAMIIPVSGWLGDRLGTKRIFLAALALFTLASALCGMANSLPMLILFRALQGIAGGAITPVGTTMLFRVFPPIERVQVARILNIPTVLAPACGPILGGFLVVHLSWHWVFFVNVPFGIAATIFGLLFLVEHREASAGRFDFPGFILAGVGLSLAMFALSEGPDLGWVSPATISTGVIGLLLLVAFVFVELRTEKPMLEIRLLRGRLFAQCNLVSFFSTAAFMGTLYAAPLFLQEARGVSALESGLTTFPEAVGVFIATQITARIYPRIGPRRLMFVGIAFVSVMMLLLSTVNDTSNLWWMRLFIFFIGFGMAHLFLPSQTAAFANITVRQTGQASAFYNTQRQVASAVGVALLSTVISLVGPTIVSSTGSVQPNVGAYHAAFIAAAVMALISGIFAFTVRDSDAASTLLRTIRQTTDTDAEEEAPRTRMEAIEGS